MAINLDQECVLDKDDVTHPGIVVRSLPLGSCLCCCEVTAFTRLSELLLEVSDQLPASEIVYLSSGTFLCWKIPQGSSSYEMAWGDD